MYQVGVQARGKTALIGPGLDGPGEVKGKVDDGPRSFRGRFNGNLGEERQLHASVQSLALAELGLQRPADECQKPCSPLRHFKTPKTLYFTSPFPSHRQTGRQRASR